MDRTTVDALKALGKALCGDSFEVTPGLTDAEMIFEIAKQYEAPEGGGSEDGGSSGSEARVIHLDRLTYTTNISEYLQFFTCTGAFVYEPDLSITDFLGAYVDGGSYFPDGETAIVSTLGLGAGQTIYLVVPVEVYDSEVVLIYEPATGHIGTKLGASEPAIPDIS